MDASRNRRKRDPARRAWYARYRQWRFARHFGFITGLSKTQTVEANLRVPVTLGMSEP